MTSQLGVWNSARLTYRAPEPHDETGILLELGHDAEAFNNAVPFVPTPQGSKAAKSHREFLDSCLLGVIICLSEEEQEDHGEAIGFLTLTGPGRGREHHGRADIAISLLARHRGQGYGSEAIRWALSWGFGFARLHRIGISAAEFNGRARGLYLKLGFREEGVKKEFSWRYGRWWDLWEGAVLESEWRGMDGGRTEWAELVATGSM